MHVSQWIHMFCSAYTLPDAHITNDKYRINKTSTIKEEKNENSLFFCEWGNEEKIKQQKSRWKEMQSDIKKLFLLFLHFI